MDVLFGVVAIAMMVGPVAVVAAWLAAAGFRPLGDLMRGRGDAADWWRGSLPWPRGVQEEDGVHWGTRQMLNREAEPDPADVIAARARTEGLYVPMTRARRHIRTR